MLWQADIFGHPANLSDSDTGLTALCASIRQFTAHVPHILNRGNVGAVRGGDFTGNISRGEIIIR